MKKIKIIIAIIILSLSLCSCEKYDKFLSVHIIDVGQGDSILIKTPNNKNILIDGGDEDNNKIINSYLKSKNIKEINMIIATHLDKDHIGTLDYIVENYTVDKIYTPNPKDDSIPYNNLLTACKNKNLKINHLSKDDSINLDKDIHISVLSPSYIQNNDNNANSIVFNLSYKEMDFLFTGDCEKENESEIINSYDLSDVDFLKVAHHGSYTSSSDTFVKEVSPKIAAISCGYKNNYGHPHKSTLDTLKKYNVKTFRTDLNGDLVFYSDGYKIFTTKKYK